MQAITEKIFNNLEQGSITLKVFKTLLQKLVSKDAVISKMLEKVNLKRRCGIPRISVSQAVLDKSLTTKPVKSSQI